jgi:glutamyl-tRNA reductase
MNKRDEVSEIMLLGLSHKTAPLEIREKFTLEGTALESFHEKAHRLGINEIVYLATCNRAEIYFTAHEIHRAMEMLTGLLEEATGLSREIFLHYIYKKHSRDVVRHLLGVASSLDSMVIGESEILGQVKQAYRDSVLHGHSGIILNRLFHQSFNTAKKVRTCTGISQNPLSIACIAVDVAGSVFDGDLSNRKALLIGAGEMGGLLLKYLTKNNIQEITVANRSLNNAKNVVDPLNKQIQIIPIENIIAAAREVDIIISSIACHDYILTHKAVGELMEKREGRPLCIIDIGVPRNVDPAVDTTPHISLYNIDDLKSVADKNLKSRLKEAETAMEIVHSDTNDLFEWYEGLELVPMIVRMKENFDSIRGKEVDRYRRRQLKHLTDADMRHIDDLTKQIISKILHNPIMAMKHDRDLTLNRNNDKNDYKDKIKIIEELFRLKS